MPIDPTNEDLHRVVTGPGQPGVGADPTAVGTSTAALEKSRCRFFGTMLWTAIWVPALSGAILSAMYWLLIAWLGITLLFLGIVVVPAIYITLSLIALSRAPSGRLGAVLLGVVLGPLLILGGAWIENTLSDTAASDARVVIDDIIAAQTTNTWVSFQRGEQIEGSDSLFACAANDGWEIHDGSLSMSGSYRPDWLQLVHVARQNLADQGFQVTTSAVVMRESSRSQRVVYAKLVVLALRDDDAAVYIVELFNEEQKRDPDRRTRRLNTQLQTVRDSCVRDLTLADVDPSGASPGQLPDALGDITGPL